MWDIIKKFFKKSSEPEIGSKKWIELEAKRIVDDISDEEIDLAWRRAWDKTFGRISKETGYLLHT